MVLFKRLPCLLLMCLIAVSAHGQQKQSKAGLLLMAHGGSPDWNEAVRKAVLPLTTLFPVSVAFGMANPETLQASVIELEQSGVSSISVVRLFISSKSFLLETQYAFGLRRPDTPVGQFMNTPQVLKIGVPVSLSGEGLMDVVSIGGILAERSARLSTNPSRESVLIVGHGPGNDTENDAWLKKMDQIADSVRELLPFHGVEVATLREDWTGKREIMEEKLRQMVLDETAAGRTVLIIPFRLFGFGPYDEVFNGLHYRADSTGFLPDPRITNWIMQQYRMLSEVKAHEYSKPVGQE